MEENIGIVLIIFVAVLTGSLLGIAIYSNNIITPMDVYQGKTTLEYTVVDGVKVDSCVIWKNKEE